MALAIPASTWARRTFGAAADDLGQAVPAALDRAHQLARAAHDIAAMTNLRTYGTTLWAKQYDELFAAISALGEARMAQLQGYALVVFGRHAFFPLRYTDRVDVPVTRARLPQPVSPQRAQLYGAHAPSVADPQPPLPGWDDPVPADRPRPLPELGADIQLITIAYACNPEAGLLRVEWGEADHVGDGALRWGHHEPLPLPSAEPELARRLRVVGAAERTARFGHGHQPDIGLDVRAAHLRELGVPPDTEHTPDQPTTQDNGRQH
ncbi:hypothetical protein [Goodfellowiella coeruleoviolacea]|uniref:Uncharacterized protein n=1 Tax=Goodfellowiella coeruleoviolacea TaxID=334858 RepID=A0AAE3GKZ0_9PSEU|nr:hypothetical protein [Goodfellowiella coeruleoviolacea]MCP2169425.1 hypothetical protein [Goodfellowiella coeruleoviolacea]